MDSPPIHQPETKPTLAEAQALVGGQVQMVQLGDGSQLLVDEDGRAKDLPRNLVAFDRFGICVVGPVVHLVDASRWTD